MTARILVIDDTPTNVKLLEAKLQAEYFDVISAHDGPTGLALAKKEAPDLILLDVMMPGMDGFEVARQLRADAKTRFIPVVMITALTDRSDRVRGLEAGADDFLSKPVNDLALFARVRSLTRMKVMLDELRIRQAASEDLGGAIEADFEQVTGDALGKVLLVESIDFTAEKIVTCLEAAGHEAVRFSHGEPALAHVREMNPDLVIVGLYLDGEDGLRLCSQFRSMEATRNTPILLILDEGDLKPLAKGLDLGVTDYLVKPIDRNELLARVKTQIRHRRYHDGLRNMLKDSVSLAYTDSLTGVYNRRYMNAHLDRKIMEIAETGKPLSLIFFDLDHFKQVNDQHGHGAGDAILRGLAKRVTGCVRNFDLLARYGGEEFVVIMPDASHDVAVSVAERLRCAIEREPMESDEAGKSLCVTASLGVATTTDFNETPDVLIERADKALYEAKRQGRNRVVSGEGADAQAIIARRSLAAQSESESEASQRAAG
jgi:two-component system cell cycle response regulator